MNTEFLMDDRCFACGQENDNGLRLKISGDASGVRSRIDLPEWCHGYAKVVHGGIIATILDEMAVWAAFKAGHRTVTGELHMRMKKPMDVGQVYTAEAKVTSVKHRLIEADSCIVDRSRAVVAQARVKLITVDG